MITNLVSNNVLWGDPERQELEAVPFIVMTTIFGTAIGYLLFNPCRSLINRAILRNPKPPEQPMIQQNQTCLKELPEPFCDLNTSLKQDTLQQNRLEDEETERPDQLNNQVTIIHRSLCLEEKMTHPQPLPQDNSSSSFAEAIALAKICPLSFIWKIRDFNLQKKELIEIANLCAHKDASRTARRIKDFGLNPEEDRDDLIKIAKICAQNKGKDTAQFIKNFGLNPQDEKDKAELIEIAIFCAKEDGSTSEHIKNFDLDPQKDKGLLRTIAKLCAEKNGYFLAQFIQNFELSSKEDKAALIEIVELCAKEGSRSVACNIRNFGFDPEEDKDVLFKTAQLCAQEDGFSTACFIKNFGFNLQKDQRKLIAIAKLCVEQNVAAFEFIREFGFNLKYPKIKKQLIEIAEFCAQKAGRKTAEYIRDLNLDPTEDKEILIKIAKLCTQPAEGGGPAQFIKNFGLDPIQDKATLIELARLCAMQNGSLTSQNIKNFQLDPVIDKPTLIELAKLCAIQSGSGTAHNIQNFEFNPDIDKEILFEIAKLCAKEGADWLAYQIQNFNLDKITRIEIAKLCAQQNGSGTTRYISHFGLNPTEDQKALIEIATLCAQQDGSATLQNLRNFKIICPKEVSKVVCFCLADMYGSGEGSLEYLRTKIADESKSHLFDPILRSQISKNQKGSVLSQIHQLVYFLSTGTKLGADEQLILDKLCEYRNRPIATHLSQRFTAMLLGHPGLDNYKKIIFPSKNQAPLFNSGTDGTKILPKTPVKKPPPQEHNDFEGIARKENPELAAHWVRPLLEISGWFRSGAPQEKQSDGSIHTENTQNKQISEGANLVEAIAKAMSPKLRRSFKNAHSGIEQQWLLTIHDLSKSSLSVEKRIVILKQICSSFKDEKEFIKQLVTISTLCSFGQEERLNQTFSADIAKELATLLETSLLEDQYVNLKDIDGFSDKYLDTWGSTRKPLSWLAYEKRLKTLRDRNVQEEFGNMIRSVLNGTFLKERCATEKSLHLKTIQEKTPELFKKWQIDPIAEAWTPGAQRELEDLFDFKQFLTQIRNDGHFNERLEQLALFLDGKTIAPSDPLVKICMELCNAPDRLEGMLSKLREIKTLVNSNSQFARDIEDLIRSASKSQESNALELVDTNDWQDLFLSGTEVLGSCQRVDGDPSLNKCLLGYVMDGKNRMVALREKNSGKLEARAIFRLLLDDENRPILFLDRTYPRNCSSEKQQALLKFAIKRAQSLGCTLVSQEYESSELFKGTLKSLSSRAPYEYEDAAGGVIPRGKFTILGLKVLWQLPL